MSEMSPERAWVRQYAASARMAAQMFLTWKLDQLRLHAGLVEAVDPMTPGARMMPYYTDPHGQVWSLFVKEKEGTDG